MITLKKLYRTLTNKFNLKLQEEWDQSGIRRFSSWEKHVNKILLCLDCTNRTIDEAIKTSCDVIISHHPIFTGSNEIKEHHNTKQILNRLKKNKISLISLHTCIDANEYGLNWYLIKMLKLKNISCIKMPNNSIKYYIGCFKQPLAFNNAINLINQTFKTNSIKYLRKTKKISTIVLSCGAGFSVLKPDLNNFDKNALIITGDIKWHDWILLDDLEINGLDVGHDLEKYFINLINEFLIDKIPRLKIIKHFPTIKLVSVNNKW